MMEFLPKPEGIYGAFGSFFLRYALPVLRSPARRDEGWMLHALCHFLRGARSAAKATLERKTIHEVIYESLKQYIRPVETAAGPDKKKKAKKKD
jgi:hypothetical protein